MNTLSEQFGRLLKVGIWVSIAFAAGGLVLAALAHWAWGLMAAYFAFFALLLIAADVRREDVLPELLKAIAEHLPPTTAEAEAVDRAVADLFQPRVKSVTYRRLKSFGNYENEAVEVQVTVPPGGTVDAAMAVAESYVSARLGLRERHDKMADQIALMQSDLAGTTVKLDAAKKEYERYRLVLEKNGIVMEDPNAPPF